MADKHLVAESIAKVTTVVHKQELNISCMEGYETPMEMSWDIYKCMGDGDEMMAKMMFAPCESES